MDIEKSADWRKGDDVPKEPSHEVAKEKPEMPPRETPTDKPKDIPESKPIEDPPDETAIDIVPEFEGTTEENYVEDDEEIEPTPDDNLPLRRPSENFYLQQN